MEITLHGIFSDSKLAKVGICSVIKRFSPVASAIEIAVLETVLNAIVVSHFADVYLAALGPHDTSLLCQFCFLFIDIIIVTQIGSQIIT